MRILFVISCNGGGMGGHNHSLNHISLALAEYCEVQIVSIGLGKVGALKDNPHYKHAFAFHWWNIWGLNGKFRKLFKSFNPDVIHCFDGASAVTLQGLPIMFSKRIMYTKCGGPNERNIVSQAAQHIILFSKENKERYDQNPRMSQSKIYHIPNRVYPNATLNKADLGIYKDDRYFTFVRIARVGTTYANSIYQGINLIEKLQNYTLPKPIRYLVIGNVEDEGVVKEIKEYASSKGVKLEHIGGQLVKKASQLLYLADVVIGTGRGVMEAMALKIPTLVPVKNGSIPSLLREVNFDQFFQTNFSPRGHFLEYDEQEEVLEILKLISNPTLFEQSKQYSYAKAEDQFILTKTVVRKYLEIYTAFVHEEKKFYFLKNMVTFMHQIDSFRRAQKNVLH